MGHTATYALPNFCTMEDEIDAFLNSEMQKDSFRYRMLLHDGRAVCRWVRRFRDHEDKLVEFLKDVGPVKRKEARMVVTGALKYFYASEEQAKERLPEILRAMRVRKLPVPGRCISPSVDRDIYMSVMKGIEQEYWDPQNPPVLFNFSDPEVIKEKSRQWSEDRSKCCDPVHTRDAGLVLVANIPRTLWSSDFCIGKIVPLKSGDRPAGPVYTWNPNLLTAYNRHEFMLMRYILWLVPELLYLPIESYKTLVHLAAAEDRTDILYYCRELGYDLSYHNPLVCDPIHIAGKESRKVLERYGAVFNQYDEKGRSWLHKAPLVPVKEARRNAIWAILIHGEDLTRRDSEGKFWLQWAIHRLLDKPNKLEKVKKLYELVTDAIKCSKSPIYDETPIRELAKLNLWDLQRAFDVCVRSGDLDKAKCCLALGCATNGLLRDGTLPLAYCIRQSDPKYDDFAVMLVANYADTNARELDGANVFRVACIHHKFEAAEELLKQGADPLLLARDGLTVLHWAYQKKDLECLEFCLTHCDVNCRDKDGVNITFRAFLDRDDALAERLQDKYGGDIQCQLDGKSLAHLAVDQGDFGRIPYLIARRIDLELKNKEGRTVLMEAVMKSEANLCETLLRHGADVNTTNEGRTALMNAADTWQVETCRVLLDHGANVNLQYPMDKKQKGAKQYGGRTALHWALYHTQSELEKIDAMIPVIECMISKMDDPDVQDVHGNTPLYLAASQGRLDICSKLLATGRVDINKTNNHGNTVLFAAAESPKFNRNLFNRLMDAGCDVNTSNKDGILPLALLIKGKWYDDAMALIRDSRCQVIDNTDSKLSPILAALDNSNQEITEELISRGVTAANKSMRTYNLYVEGPIPTLMRWKMFDHARWLWDFAKDKAGVSRTKDCNDRTPLIYCLRERQDAWAQELLSPGYDLTAQDCDGVTPLMYCAINRQYEWTKWICGQISMKEIGRMDKRGCSALTHMANHKWIDLCDQLFLADVAIPDRIDCEGVIKRYISVLDARDRALERGQRALDDITESIDKGSRRLAKHIKYLTSKYEHLSKESSNKIPKVEKRLDKLRELRREKKAQYEELENSSRRDWVEDYDGMIRFTDRLCRMPYSLDWD